MDDNKAKKNLPSVRFPELLENPNWKHNHSQHHYQHCGLSAPSSGVLSTNIKPENVHSLLLAPPS